MLSSLLLTACSSAIVRADNEQVICQFQFNEHDNVIIHSDLQSTYLNDDYRNISSYASGNAELSRPKSFTLEWDCSINTLEEVNNYYLSVKTELGDSEFITYVCETNSYTFTNLMIDTTYYYFVTANYDNYSFSSDIQYFKTENKGPRNLYISGITNARDLGGYVTEQGKLVKQGLIFRTGQLNHSYTTAIDPRITLQGRKTMLEDLKIKSEIDLREVKNNESGALYDSILGKEVNYFPYHMSWDVVNIAKNESEMMKNVFKVFADRRNYPVVFHCAIGTDRTGVVAFYLNALLGVQLEDIYRDYLYSNFGNIGGARVIDNAISHYQYLTNNYPGDSLQEKAYNYFLSIGLSNIELDTICQIMLK